jgi:hypothetical protein
MKIQKPSPLNWQSPIVDERGRPTPDFILCFSQLITNAANAVLNSIGSLKSTGSLEQQPDGTVVTRPVDTGTGDSLLTQDAGDSRYVNENVGPAWTAPTGTPSRATFVTYPGQTVSNPPTQAEVQAIDDHLKILSQRLKALIDDLQANNSLT